MDKKEWICRSGVIAKGFPVDNKNIEVRTFGIEDDVAQVSKKFSSDKPSKTPFENAGVMINNQVYTTKVTSKYKGKLTVLEDIILEEEVVPKEFFIDRKELEKWKYLKGGKKEERCSKSGFTYHYSEGPMVFPDELDKPSRTIVTGEGGSGPSRFKHVIKTKSGKLRRLTPLELERLNMFPDDHTEGVSDTKRAFIMGNALVVGVIERLGRSLCKFIGNE